MVFGRPSLYENVEVYKTIFFGDVLCAKGKTTLTEEYLIQLTTSFLHVIISSLL